MYCPNCGEQLDDSARFCPKCGTQIGGGAPAAQAGGYRSSRSNRSLDFDPKDRMMRLIWAIVVVFAFMLVFGGYHLLKTNLGL